MQKYTPEEARDLKSSGHLPEWAKINESVQETDGGVIDFADSKDAESDEDESGEDESESGSDDSIDDI